MNLENYDWDRLDGLGFAEKAKEGLKSACWSGYEAIGMKPGKGGKMVPNCVPTKKKKKGTSDHAEDPSQGRIPTGGKRRPVIQGPSAGSPSFNEYSEYIGGFDDELVQEFKEQYMDYRLVPASGGMTIDVECDTNLPVSTPAELMEQKQRKRTSTAMKRAERAEKREMREKAKVAKRRTKDLKKMKGETDFAEGRGKPCGGSHISAVKTCKVGGGTAQAPQVDRVKKWEEDRKKTYDSLKGKSKKEVLAELNQHQRIHSLTEKDTMSDLKNGVVAAIHGNTPPRNNGGSTPVAPVPPKDRMSKKDPVAKVLKSQEELKDFNKRENARLMEMIKAGKVKGVTMDDVKRIAARRREEGRS